MKLKEQSRKADVACPIMMSVGFLRVHASKPRFSGAAEALEDQACTLLYVLACGDLAHQIPVEPTLLSVIDVVDVCRRKAKLRLPDQPFRLHLVLILVETLHKGIETLGSRTIQIIKGRCREADSERRVCEKCGTKFVQNGTVITRIRHVPDGNNCRFLEVKRHRYRCPVFGCSQDQPIPFKDDEHFVIAQLITFAECLLEGG